MLSKRGRGHAGLSHKIDIKLSFSPLKLSQRNLGVEGLWIKCSKIPMEGSKVLVICGLFASRGQSEGAQGCLGGIFCDRNAMVTTFTSDFNLPIVEQQKTVFDWKGGTPGPPYICRHPRRG